MSIIIVSYNTCDALSRCLRILGDKREVIVVDNCSMDGSIEMVKREFPNVRLMENNVNEGFARGVNRGAREASENTLFLVNPDAVVTEEVFMRAEEQLIDDVGIVGAQLIDEMGREVFSGGRLPSVWKDWKRLAGFKEVGDVEWFPFAFAAIRKEVFEAMGGLDERFFLYFEDVDFCHRLQEKGYQVIVMKELRVMHAGGVSAKTLGEERQISLWHMESELLYYRKHRGFAVTTFRLWMERSWYFLRILKNLLVLNKVKIDESKKIRKLLKQAKLETNSGLTTPPIPWKLQHIKCE